MNIPATLLNISEVKLYIFINDVYVGNDTFVFVLYTATPYGATLTRRGYVAAVNAGAEHVPE